MASVYYFDIDYNTISTMTSGRISGGFFGYYVIDDDLVQDFCAQYKPLLITCLGLENPAVTGIAHPYFEPSGRAEGYWFLTPEEKTELSIYLAKAQLQGDNIENRMRRLLTDFYRHRLLACPLISPTNIDGVWRVELASPDSPRICFVLQLAKVKTPIHRYPIDFL